MFAGLIYDPLEFVTLKDGSEGLLIFNYDNKAYKFLDPFYPSDVIDVTDDIFTNGFDVIFDKRTKIPKNIIITKSNKKFYIKENNVWVTDGLNEDTFQQMLNTTYHSNIYTLPIFKTIRNMLNDIINDKGCDFSEDNKITIDGEPFRFILKKAKDQIEVKGFTKLHNSNETSGNYSTIST